MAPAVAAVRCHAATVVVASLLLAGLALLVPMPRILSDELRYTIAASSLADGDGLHLRGSGCGFGPVRSRARVDPRRRPRPGSAYPLFKLANALLFALAAAPIYLVVRRLLDPAWSLAVAALSLVVPSSIYVSLVMTESAAYPAAWVAILAIVLALERTSPARQLAVLGAVALAYLTRRSSRPSPRVRRGARPALDRRPRPATAESARARRALADDRRRRAGPRPRRRGAARDRELARGAAVGVRRPLEAYDLVDVGSGSCTTSRRSTCSSWSSRSPSPRSCSPSCCVRPGRATSARVPSRWRSSP